MPHEEEPEPVARAQYVLYANPQLLRIGADNLTTTDADLEGDGR
ncbi:hypothetical protein ACFWUQ_22885 [Streptomyces sp. NPDC058662]